ncbi:MAG: tetratricopeptide repeat protein [Candidatus Eisenbacteria bacterium]
MTTRERLHLRDEVVLSLEPLDPTHEGLELFELRAQGQRAGFRLDDATRPTAASIVRRLDGLPLAIELAAARLRMLSLTQLESRLADRFQLLAGGQRGRQSTLRTTLDWSWDLLLPWEQATVRQASLFEGGFTLEAAEAVIDLAPHRDAPMVLDVLQSLLDKSWLRARVEADAPRFSMYVTVQEYARAKLDDVLEATTGEARHGAYFVTLGREVGGSALDRVGSALARSTLERELDNIVVACRRAVARNDEAVAVPLFLAAHSFLVKHGPWKLSVELGREVRPVVTTLGPRAEFLASLGAACFNVGALAEARADLTESVEALEALGNHAATAAPRLTLGFIEHQEGNIDAARGHYETALEAVRGLGNLRVEAAALSALGIVHLDQGRTAEATSTLEAAVDAAVEIGDRRREAIARGNLAILYRQVGKLHDARREAERSIQCNREVGSRQQEAVMLSNLGNICLDEGRIEEAREAWYAALALNREIGSRLNEAAVLSTLGQMHVREGELDQAVDLLSQALVISREVSDSRNIGIALAALAGVDRRQGRLADARRRAQESMALMRDLDQVAYASALCTLAEVEHDDGNAAAAHAAFDAARNVAAEFGVMPGSELANIIEATRRALGLDV